MVRRTKKDGGKGDEGRERGVYEQGRSLTSALKT